MALRDGPLTILKETISMMSELEAKHMEGWEPPVCASVVNGDLLQESLEIQCPGAPVFKVPAGNIPAVRAALCVGGLTVAQTSGEKLSRALCLRLTFWDRLRTHLQVGHPFSVPLLRGHCNTLGVPILGDGVDGGAHFFRFGVATDDVFESDSDEPDAFDDDAEDVPQEGGWLRRRTWS